MEATLKSIERLAAAKQHGNAKKRRDIARQYEADVLRGEREPEGFHGEAEYVIPVPVETHQLPTCHQSYTSEDGSTRPRTPTRAPHASQSGDIVISVPHMLPADPARDEGAVINPLNVDDFDAFIAELNSAVKASPRRSTATQPAPDRFGLNHSGLDISFPLIARAPPPLSTPYRNKASLFRTEMPYSVHPADYTASAPRSFFVSTLHAVPPVAGGKEPADLATMLSRIEIPLSLTQAEVVMAVRATVTDALLPTSAPSSPQISPPPQALGNSTITLSDVHFPKAVLHWYDVLPCTTLPYNHIARRKQRTQELLTTAVAAARDCISSEGCSRKAVSNSVVGALRDDLSDWRRCADDEILLSPLPPFTAGFSSKTAEDSVANTAGDILRAVLSQLKQQHDGLFGEALRHHSGFILRRIPAEVKRGIMDEGCSWDGARARVPNLSVSSKGTLVGAAGGLSSLSLSNGGGRVWNDLPRSGSLPEDPQLMPNSLGGGPSSPVNPPTAATENIIMLKKALVVLVWFFVAVTRREQLQAELMVLSRRLCETPPQYGDFDEAAVLESPKLDQSLGSGAASPRSVMKRGSSLSSTPKGVAILGTTHQPGRPRLLSKRNASTRKTRSGTVASGLAELSAITQEMMAQDGGDGGVNKGSSDDSLSDPVDSLTQSTAAGLLLGETGQRMSFLRDQIAEYTRMEDALFEGLGDILGRSLQQTLSGRGGESSSTSGPNRRHGATLLSSGFEARVARDEFLDVIPLFLTYCVRYAVAESFPDDDHRHEDDVAEQRANEKEQEVDRARRHRHDADSKKTKALKDNRGGFQRRALWKDPRFKVPSEATNASRRSGGMGAQYFTPFPVAVPEIYFGDDPAGGARSRLTATGNSKAAKLMEGLDKWDQLLGSAHNTTFTLEFTHRIYRQITMWTTGVDPYVSCVEAAKNAFAQQRTLEEALLNRHGISAHLATTEEQQSNGDGLRRNDSAASDDDDGGGGGNNKLPAVGSTAAMGRRQADILASALLPGAFPHPCMASDQSKVVQFRPTGFDTMGVSLRDSEGGGNNHPFSSTFMTETNHPSDKDLQSVRERALHYDAERKSRRAEQAKTLTTTTSKRWEDHGQCRTVVCTRQEVPSGDTVEVIPTWQFHAPAWSAVNSEILLDLLLSSYEENAPPANHRPLDLESHLRRLAVVPYPVYGYSPAEEEAIAAMPPFHNRADANDGAVSTTKRFGGHRSPLVQLYLSRFGHESKRGAMTSSVLTLPALPSSRGNTNGVAAGSVRSTSERSQRPAVSPPQPTSARIVTRDRSAVVSYNFSGIASEHKARAEKMIEEGNKEFRAFKQREHATVIETTENRKHRDRLIAYTKAMVQYSRSPRNPEKVRMARKIELALRNALRVYNHYCKVGQYMSGRIEALESSDPFAKNACASDFVVGGGGNEADANIIRQLPHYLITTRPLDKLDVVRALQFACGLYEAEIQSMTCDSLVRDQLLKLWSECAGRRRNLSRDPLMERCNVSKELRAAISPSSSLPPPPPPVQIPEVEPHFVDKWVLERPSQNGVICSPPSTLLEVLNGHQEQIKQDNWPLLQRSDMNEMTSPLHLPKPDIAEGDAYLDALSTRLVAKTGFEGESAETVMVGRQLVQTLHLQGKSVDPPPPAYVRTPPKNADSREGRQSKHRSSSSTTVMSMRPAPAKAEEPKTVYWEGQKALERQQQAMERLKYKNEMDHLHLEVDLFIAQNSGARRHNNKDDEDDGVDSAVVEVDSPLSRGTETPFDAAHSFSGMTGDRGESDSFSLRVPSDGGPVTLLEEGSVPPSSVGAATTTPLVPSPPPNRHSPLRPVPKEFQTTHEQVQRRLEDITAGKSKDEKRVASAKRKEGAVLASLLHPARGSIPHPLVGPPPPSLLSTGDMVTPRTSPPRHTPNVSAILKSKYQAGEDEDLPSVSVATPVNTDPFVGERRMSLSILSDSVKAPRSRSGTVTDLSRMVVQSATLSAALQAQQKHIETVRRASQSMYDETTDDREVKEGGDVLQDLNHPLVHELPAGEVAVGGLPPRPSETREGARLPPFRSGGNSARPMHRRETPTEDRSGATSALDAM